jgi:hypothetical protein
MKDVNLNGLGEVTFKNSIVKNWLGLSAFYFQLLECILQVLQTSTDPCQQFMVPFKAA